MMKHAKLYNSVNDIAIIHAQELLKKYVETIQKGFNGNHRILDIGCGDGSVTKILTEYLPRAQWSACDISLDMINFAKRTYGQLEIEFFYLNILNEIKEELRSRFDCVVCLFVLHRILNQSSVNNISKSHGAELIQKYGKIIQKGWDRNTSILDVGCGDGAVTKVLKTHLPQAQWSACDISLDMIKLAEKTNSELDLYFFPLDIRNKIKEELIGRFDCIFSLFVLHRIHNQRRAFSNIHSLLKPKGRCLISVMCEAEMFDIDIRMAKQSRWSNYIRDVQQLISPYHGLKNPEESLKTVMLECGFQDVVVATKKIAWPFDDTGKFRNLIRCVDPCLPKIPLKLQEKYVDDYLEILSDDGVDSPPLYYRCSVVEAIAYK